MGAVAASFAVLLAVIALGWLLGRSEVLGPDASRVLARLSFFVATPALLLTTLSAADLATVFSSTLVVSALSVLVVGLVAAGFSGGLWRRAVPDVAVTVLASTYVNAGNLGVALAVYVLGDASLVASVLLLQLLVMAPLGLAVLDASTSPDPARLRTLVLQPLRTPLTLACLLGVLLAATGWVLPEIVARPVVLVGDMAVPAALLAYGMSLHGAALPGSGPGRRDVWLVVGLKAALQPAVAYGLGQAFGLQDRQLLAVTLTAALPTAQNVFVYASTYDRGTALARDAIALTTVATAPLLLALPVLLG